MNCGAAKPHKDGNCIFFSLVTLMLMRVYEINMSGSLFLTLWVSVCIMARENNMLEEEKYFA